MTFCENCGSYMKETAEGLLCPRCGRLVSSKTRTKTVRERAENKRNSSIYVVENRERLARVTQPCPKCGHREAFHWVSSISGEHAGVRRERTVEHFRCAKCSHTWTRSS